MPFLTSKNVPKVCLISRCIAYTLSVLDTKPTKFLSMKTLNSSVSKIISDLILPVIFFFLYLNTYATGLSGTYTIGGSSPSYSSIGAAVSAINSNGVSGAVIFNIRSGTYNEQISINAISGASSTNTITFQSETGVNTDVIITYSASVTYDYVIKLNGADYIKFKYLSIQITGTASYPYVIVFTNGADNNLLDHNILTGTSGSLDGAIIYTSGSYNNHYNQFTNNLFQNGSYGFYYWGKTSSVANGLVISNNTFTGQSNGAIALVYMSAPLISQNTIVGSNSDNNSYAAIELSTCSNSITIEKNKISGIWGYGIYMVTNSSSSSAYALITNNFIQLGSSTAFNAYGIYLKGQTYLKAYYNSINISQIYSTSTNRAALYFNSTAGSNNNLYFYNNIFVNAAGGELVDASTVPTSVQFNYNDFYTSGSSFALWGTTSVSSFSNWQSTTGFDANSYAVDPSFTSTTDLHTASSTLCDAGTPLAEVTTDIDGVSRSASTPDIGADEYQVLTDDAALISFTSPTKPFATGSQSVKVTLFNNGVNTISSASIVWSVNGVAQTNASWNGSLASGASITATLGNYSFSIGTSYTIVATVSSPNGHTDAKGSNNQITSSPLYAAYSGTYTIGPSGANFTSLSSANTALQNGGMVGAVTLNINSGSYTDQVSVSQISGSSSANTLTIQSTSGNNTDVTISASGSSTNNYIIQLNGADYVSIKNVKLQNSSTSYSRVLEFTNNADNNSIDNCVIYGGSSSSTSTNLALVYCGSGILNQNNSITNNTIQTGSYGIYYFGKGTSSSDLAPNITVTGNTISSVKSRAIYMGYLSSATISQNNITGYAYTSFYGIYVPNSTCSGSNSIRIEKNKITGGYGYGIYLSNIAGSSTANALIANNFIQVGGSTSRGIYLSSNSYLKIYHNSVNITGTATTSNSAALYFSGSLNNLQIKNNIFANTGGGYVIYASSTSNTSSSCNYNDLYKTGTNLAYWSSTNRTDLAAWQSASSLDANSLSTNPNFVSTTNLKISASALNNVGTPLSDVTTDIDGESRSITTPDIGADEMPAAKTDLDNISEIETNEDEILWLYPNPAADIANIDVTIENTESDVEINIYDLSGKMTQKIYAGTIENGKHTFKFDMSQFDSGIYFIMLREDNKIYQKRLVVRR